MAFTTDIINALQNKVNESSDVAIVFGRHEFLKSKTWIAAPVVVVIVLASVVGTFGNVLILAVICSNTLGRNVTITFITNLAISDLFMTLVADPMNVVGMFKSLYLTVLSSKLVPVNEANVFVLLSHDFCITATAIIVIIINLSALQM